MWNRVIYNYGEQVGNAIFLHDVNGLIKRRQAMFRCVCGNKFIAQVYKIKTFQTQSCGCLQKKAASEANSKHKLTNHKLYKVWKSMRARCNNKNVKQYKDYGGKGVSVCSEWDNDFIAFYRWAIANGWEPGLQLDKDTKGIGVIYGPEYCCFITPKQNSDKRSTTAIILFNGKRQSVSRWSDEMNIPIKIIHQRIKRGWSVKKALTTSTCRT